MRKLFSVFVAMVISFAVCLSASATPTHDPDPLFRVEGGIGYDYGVVQGNGIWYQEGFPYTLNLNHPTWMVGITGKVNRYMDWHIDYQNLGISRSDSLDTPDDANYNPANSPPCNGPCVAISNYVGSGSANGIKLLLDFHTLETPHKPVFGVSVGPYIFKPIWRETVYNWKGAADQPGRTITWSTENKFLTGNVVGVFMRYDDLELRLERIVARCTPAGQECLWKSFTNLSVIYRF